MGTKIKYDLLYTFKGLFDAPEDKSKTLNRKQQQEFEQIVANMDEETQKAILLLICENAKYKGYKIDKKNLRLPYACVVKDENVSFQWCHIPKNLQQILHNFALRTKVT